MLLRATPQHFAVDAIALQPRCLGLSGAAQCRRARVCLEGGAQGKAVWCALEEDRGGGRVLGATKLTGSPRHCRTHPGERPPRQARVCAAPPRGPLLQPRHGSPAPRPRPRQVVESPDTLYLLTEVMSGGELFDTLQGTKTFSEQARGCPHLSSWTSDFARAAPPHAPAAAQRQRHTASPNISCTPVQVCRMVTVQLASALAHLHLRHFTAHCDLKPANILCRRHRPRPRLRPQPRPVQAAR